MNRTEEDTDIEAMLGADADALPPLAAPDAAAERAAAAEEQARAERGIPPLRKGSFGLSPAVLMGMAVVGVVGMMLWVRKPGVQTQTAPMTKIDARAPAIQTEPDKTAAPALPFQITPEKAAAAPDGKTPVVPVPVTGSGALANGADQDLQQRLAEAKQRQQEARDLIKRRLQSTILVSNGSGDGTQVAATGQPPDTPDTAANGSKPPVLSADGNTAFLQNAAASGADTEQSHLLRNQAALVPQGTLVAGVLETAVNSDLPGMLRAVVATDVYAFDNGKVMIPRGTRLIGQYRSGIAIGQTRAFVVWNRLITPEGVSINLGSPGTDELGEAGMTGHIDEHFFKRFGAALLVSVINGGIQAGSNAVSNNSNSQIVLGSAADNSRIIEQILSQRVNIPPTIKVAQGTPIRIFVNKDLDFSPTEKLALLK